MQDLLLIILIAVGFCVGFAALWSGIVFLISRMSGWARLAEEYPATGRIQGSTYRYSSARLRFLTNYSNCLTVIVSSNGLYLEPMWAFRIGHSAMLIPRDAVLHYHKGAFPIFRSMRLKIKRRDGEPPTTITLYGRGLADALEQWLRAS
ncbi:MAG: hypothetical protein ABJM29_10755 [Rhizobiaceae bacterium]